MRVRTAQLLAFDFDKTLALTHLPSPRGLTVETAYARALDRICNTTNLLQKLGGLQNRAPGEIASAALAFNPSFYDDVRAYYAGEHATLEEVVPRGKGVCLTQEGVSPVDFFSEVLTRVKLVQLMEEVGVSPLWPTPAEGVLELLHAWGDRPWGIISSGHDSFILKVLQLWQVERSPLLLTDDDMRASVLPVEDKTKPSPTIMRSFIARAGRQKIRVLPRSVLFIGDDLRTDGGLAANAHTGFIWYNPGQAQGELPPRAAQIQHFNELTACL